MQGLGEDGPGDPLLPSTTGSRAATFCLPAALLAVHWGQGLEGDRGGDYIVSILGKKILPFLGAGVVVVEAEDPVDRGSQDPWCHLQSP